MQDYSYDRLNRLTSSRQFNAGVETDSAVYVHDPLDRPVAQTERHGSEIRQTTLSYRGPTGELASEQQRDGQGALLVTKRYGYDQLGLKASLESTPAGQGSSRYAYAYDAHGSVSLLTNGGSASAAYAYTPYGKPDSALTKGDPSSTNPLNPYRYTAKRLDSGSGTLDMGARRFHPDGGRFLQHDSYTNALANLALATDPLTGNRYSLAAGNPISYVEVDGHYVTDVDGAGETTKLAGQPAYNVVGVSPGSGDQGGFRLLADGGQAFVDDIPDGPCTYQGGWADCDSVAEDPVPEIVLSPGGKLKAGIQAAKRGIQKAANAAKSLWGKIKKPAKPPTAAKEGRHAIPEGRLGHIFRDAPGHLPDTPANRKLLQGVADDPATTLGPDKFGNTWSARTLDDGTQVWVQTRNGDIINGGLNQTPRTFNLRTGLSRPQPPRRR